MQDLLKRFSSRKFLLTIAIIVALTLFPDLPDQVVYMALTFVGAEGLRDTVAAWRAAPVDIAKTELERTKVLNGWTAAEVANSTDARTIVSGKPE